MERSQWLGRYHGEGSRYPRSTGAEIADLSPHDLSRTLVSHGGVDLAAGWDRHPEAVKPAATAEWLRYQLGDGPVGELALEAEGMGQVTVMAGCSGGRGPRRGFETSQVAFARLPRGVC